MALQQNAVTSASIASATTTTLVTAGTNERIYVYYVGVDVTSAWTGGTLDVASANAAIRVGFFSTAAAGHQSDYQQMPLNGGFNGLPLPIGQNLVAISAGTPGALTLTVIYEIKGSA